MQDILLTNHGAHKELNNHNIYNIHNWIDLNTHNMKTIDRINIHKKPKMLMLIIIELVVP
jgi:hypothetical protein